MKPSRRARLCRLLVLPLLLLIPLGVAKWRADHPPVSKMDRVFQDALSKAEVIYIAGGGEVWERVTHLGDDQLIIVKDRKVFTEMKDVLRMSDTAWPSDGNYDGDISLGVTSRTNHTSPTFNYARKPDDKGSYIIYWNQGDEQARVTVPSRFGPRFEAYVGQLTKRAKAPGKHPEIVLATHGF